MFFKKKKIKSKQQKIQKIPLILGTLGVLCILFLWSIVVHGMNNINFQVFDFANSSGSLNIFWGNNNPSDENKDMTYILITGRWGGTHDAPNLTDTIILAGLNKKNETITLFSLPRDFYVKYPESGYGRINGVYERYILEGEDVAMQKLSETISMITGKNIDFYVNIDFQGFIEIVDALGGVEVTLEKNFADYEYPDGNRGYKTFILREGTWVLDGEVALMYARSRHSTSDFDRSLRQQEIISGIKKKAGELGYLKDRKKILELYDIFKEYVVTDLSLTDMVKLGLMVRGWDDSQTLSFNLSYECGALECKPGAFLYAPDRNLFGGASVLLPVGGSTSKITAYEDIQKFSNLIYDKSSLYVQPQKITIHNNSSKTGLARQLTETLRPYWFDVEALNTTKQELAWESLQESILYYNGIDEDNQTLEALKTFLDIPMQKIETPKYSGSGTNIEIILAGNITF